MLQSIVTLFFASVGMIMFCSASDVIDGTNGNFKELIKEGLTLVEFYAPWCGHCKKLAPEWESAATALKGQAKLVKVDATVEEELASTQELAGYPTIKVFLDGVSSVYEGGRTAEAIVAFVQRRLSPPVQILTTEEAIKEYKLKHSVAFFLFTNSKDDEIFFQYESLAKIHSEAYQFAAVFDSAHFDGNKAGDVVVYKHFDNLKGKYEGDIKNKEEFAQFLGTEGFKLVDEVGPDNYRQYVDRKLPMMWLFLETEKAEVSDAAKAALQNVAVENKGKLSVVYLDGVRYKQMAERYGFSGNKFPCLAIDHGEGKYYSFPEGDAIKEATILEFTKKYFAGTLTKTVKSAAAPDQHTVNGLTTVVGSQFAELVLNSNKDVMIEFYAPWCGHCKSLDPIYKKLAKQTENIKTLTIAQMDSTANDHEGNFEVNGFPTLYFKPAGKDPISYDGERTQEDILAFIKKHATNPVDVSDDKSEL